MIVAEIGMNGMGSMGLNKQLIKNAKDGGAALAKFQLFSPEKLYPIDSDLFKNAKKCELSFQDAKELFDYGKEIGIEVFFSVFDVERVRWCEEIGVLRYKVAFSQRCNYDLFQVLPLDKPIIASTTFDDYRWVAGCVDYLYCISKYPSTLKDLDHRFANCFGEDEDIEFAGFSDHTIGLDASKIALARGARIIEKHFCLDHNTGVDAPWSMDLKELKELVRWEKICQEIL